MAYEKRANSVSSNPIVRESRVINDEDWDALEEKIATLKSDYIESKDVHQALEIWNLKIPKYQLNHILSQNYGNKTDQKLSRDEFLRLYYDLYTQTNVGMTYKTLVKTKQNVEQFSTSDRVENNQSDLSMKNNQSDNTSSVYHTATVEERIAFTDWINKNLADDSFLQLKKNPIDPNDPQALYQRCADGVLLCKLINKAVPNTIDERALNMDTKFDIFRSGENLELAINSARGIGCKVINIHVENILKGIPHLILGLLWQIIRAGLTYDINLIQVPGLLQLLRDGETVEDLLKLSPEELLLRWVNYHLKRSSYKGKEVTNFSNDIKNSEAYTYLLQQIAPADTNPALSLSPLQENDLRSRAELMLKEADKIKARAFISPNDVVKGNPKLNFAFVANLFNSYPALDVPVDRPVDEVLVQETREEKTYRNWINSMELKDISFVNYLYSDLSDGLIILRLYDEIRPGTVDWKKVYEKFQAIKEHFQKLSNCNLAIEIGKEPMGLKLIGIGGANILNGNKTLTLGLVWQIMRAYTLSLLTKLAGTKTPIADREIIEWANKKLQNGNKTRFLNTFQDSDLSDAKLLCDLIDAIKPGSIQYELLKNDSMANARYCISIARKIGARVYALPEDIVEGKHKMIMTIFATLMTRDYQNR